jgi:hypothetical protein
MIVQFGERLHFLRACLSGMKLKKKGEQITKRGHGWYKNVHKLAKKQKSVDAVILLL